MVTSIHCVGHFGYVLRDDGFAEAGVKRFATRASILLAFLAVPAAAQSAKQSQSGGEVRRQIAAALERGDRTAVTANALLLARMEGSLSDATFTRIAPFLDAAQITAARIPWIRNSTESPIEALHSFFRYLADPRQRGELGEPVAMVPAEYRLVEGIAWDAKTRRLFIGTVIDGRLAYRDEAGQWHEVPLGFPRASLFGMAVDPTRRLLWITTGSVEQTAVAGERMTGLIAVNLDSLQVVRRVPLAPEAKGVAGDLVIASDGTVYVTNVTSGAVHRCAPGCTTLEDWLPAGSWKNPQGMALFDKDRRLYLADYMTGLWVIDTRTRRFRQVETRDPTMLDGIDGLVAGPEGMMAIQNGTSPRRIVKLYRARDGWLGPISWRHIFASTRAIAGREAGDPTLGASDGGEMYFVMDGQWERYGPGGSIIDGKPPRPTPIGRMDLYDVFIT